MAFDHQAGVHKYKPPEKHENNTADFIAGPVPDDALAPFGTVATTCRPGIWTGGLFELWTGLHFDYEGGGGGGELRLWRKDTNCRGLNTVCVFMYIPLLSGEFRKIVEGLVSPGIGNHQCKDKKVVGLFYIYYGNSNTG